MICIDLSICLQLDSTESGFIVIEHIEKLDCIRRVDQWNVALLLLSLVYSRKKFNHIVQQIFNLITADALTSLNDITSTSPALIPFPREQISQFNLSLTRSLNGQAACISFGFFL